MGDSVESVSDVVQVLSVQTGDGDTAIHSHVNGVLFAELVNLVLVQAGEGEHANLVGNVAPVVLVADGGQLVAEAVAHFLHAARHVSQVLVPHGGELGVTEDDIDNAGTVNGRVRVDGPGNLLDTAHDNFLLSFTATDGGVTSSTLTVEAKVLGERLEEHNVVSVLLEQLEGEAILLEVAGGKALISAIKGREELLSLDNLEDFLPLPIGRVNSGGVVGTDVEHDDRVVLGVVQVLLEALEVETLGLLAVVAVILPLVANEVGDGPVDGPGLVGNQEINILVGVPLGEEGETEAKSTCARDRLGTGNSVLLAGSAALTVGEGEALLDVRVDTVDGGVLVIHVALKDELLSTLDARKDEGLVVVISVCAHAQEDLLGVSLLLVGVVKTKDGISGG